jgi:GcrA cell cycle regulator
MGLQAYRDENRRTMKKLIKKTVSELDSCDCRWPFGDPRNTDFHFCGAQSVVGRPYCQEHWDASYVASKPRLTSKSPAIAIARAA